MIGKRVEYESMALCERKLWWYKSLHSLVINKLRFSNLGHDINILDAGCGTGGMLSVFIENGYKNCVGFDLSEDAIEYALKTYGLNVQSLDICNASAKFPHNSFDVVVSNDVLYLLNKDDANSALKGLLTLLKPSGLLLLNMPAGKLFRGTHDIAVEIQERHSKKSIQKLIGSSATIVEMIYWPFLLSPLILAVRLFQRIQLTFNKNLTIVSDVELPPNFINKFFYRITQFENRFFGWKPWGSSIFVILRKGK